MKNYVLKYNKPAEYSENGWQNEVLPIGNGMLGMCVFGGVSEEHLQFNEKTVKEQKGLYRRKYRKQL